MSLRSVLALLLLSPVAMADSLVHYGALAIDRRDGFHYGWANDHATLAEAAERAVSECHRHGGNCHVVLAWSGPGCGAYRTIDGKVGTAYGWGGAATKEEADAIARTEAAKRSRGAPATNFVWGCNAKTPEPFRPLFDAGRGIEAQTFETSAKVESLAISPDSKTIAVADLGGRISLWDVASGRQQQTLRVDGDRVFDVAYSPDGRWLAAADVKNQALVWDVASSRLVHRFATRKESAWAVAFSPDSRRLAVGSSSGADFDAGDVQIWDLDTGSLDGSDEQLFEGSTVNSLAWAKDGTLAAGASPYHSKRNFLVRPGGGWRAPDSFADGAMDVAFSDDGTVFAAGLGNGTAEVFTAPGFRRVATVSPKDAEIVHAVALSPDGRELATGDRAGMVRIWDPETGKLLETLEGHEAKSWVHGLAYAPDGSFLVSGGWDKTLHVWPREGGTHDDELRKVIEAEGQHLKEAGKTRALMGASEARKRRDAAKSP